MKMKIFKILIVCCIFCFFLFKIYDLNKEVNSVRNQIVELKFFIINNYTMKENFQVYTNNLNDGINILERRIIYSEIINNNIGRTTDEIDSLYYASMSNDNEIEL
jgi:hypothetical protein